MVEHVFNLFIKELSIRAKKTSASTYFTLANNHILYRFKERDICTISEEELIEHIIMEKNNNLSGNTDLLSSKSVYDITTFINTLWKFAYNKGFTKNLIHLSMPKLERKHTEIFCEEDKNKIINYILNHMTPHGSAILLCLYTGIRIGEICCLKWGDIDLKENCIDITKTIQRIKNLDEDKKTKTKIIIDTAKSEKSIRLIPIPNLLVNLLTMLKRDNDCYVASGTPVFIEPRLMQKKYKTLLKHAEVDYKKFHVLRHTFATDACNNGMSVKTLSEILGHADIKTTLKLYVHTSMEQKQKEMNLIYTALPAL